MAGNPEDPTTWRSIRVPADNCPRCLGPETCVVMAMFSEATPDSPKGGMQVAYRCRSCTESWMTAWSKENIA